MNCESQRVTGCLSNEREAFGNRRSACGHTSYLRINAKSRCWPKTDIQSRMPRWKERIRIAIARCSLLFSVMSVICTDALAQGCASCYTTAAAGGPQTAHALRSGILVLLAPPVLIFAGTIAIVRIWKSARRDLSGPAATENISDSDIGR